MIHVDDKLVEHLSRLSRIACPKEKIPAMVSDLQQIIVYFEELDKVATDDVEASTSVSKFITQAPLREDVPNNSVPQKTALEIFPEHIAQLDRIPTVMKEEMT